MRFVVFLADGAADLPISELGNKTPLQVANKPAIDRIARLGRCGSFVTVDDDMPPGSEVANLTVLGYDPHECYQGRGVIEAASMGVQLRDADIAMRCNLICIADGRIKNHSAGHISTEEAHKLICHVDRYLGCDDVRFFPGISYRHLLLLSSGDSSTLEPLNPRTLEPISVDFECFPPHDHVGELAEDLMIVAKSDEAKSTVDRLNDLVRCSWELLSRHAVNQARVKAGKDPANSIWFWSQGRKPKMKTHKEQYGITGAVISAVDLIKGLGVYAGLDVIDVPGATGLIDTNYEGKADACLKALDDHDFVFVHVEASDEAGHAKDLKQKILAIEYLDSRLVARVMKGLEDRGIEATVAVLPDHLTPVAQGNHVHGPVPVAIWNPHLTPDSVQSYDESACASGSLGMLHGSDFIRTLLSR
ncbi:MAG: cofactor-independent phosphoglycerate mutase [candidate division WOR-3 bacterium]|nr:cofactor-independent phosphoglycerate mutase [candidate division WOR-3 bacterium]